MAVIKPEGIFSNIPLPKILFIRSRTSSDISQSIGHILSRKNLAQKVKKFFNDVRFNYRDSPGDQFTNFGKLINFCNRWVGYKRSSGYFWKGNNFFSKTFEVGILVDETKLFKGAVAST